MSSEPFCTIQEEVALSLKSISEIHINTSIIHSISSLLKELTADNIFSVVKKLQYQPVMFFQSIALLKVLLSATLNHQLEIKVNIQDALELMPPLSDIQMMEVEPESDYHQVPEKLFQAFAEPPSELLPEEVETKSLS